MQLYVSYNAIICIIWCNYMLYTKPFDCDQYIWLRPKQIVWAQLVYLTDSMDWLTKWFDRPFDRPNDLVVLSSNGLGGLSSNDLVDLRLSTSKAKDSRWSDASNLIRRQTTTFCSATHKSWVKLKPPTLSC